MRRLAPIILFAPLLWQPTGGANGQEPSGEIERADTDRPASGAPAAPADEDRDSPVREAQPPLHLLDEEGRLVPVPGIRLEDFERMLQEQNSDRPKRPRYSLQNLHITGTVVDGLATLTAEIEVLLNVDDWVRVPLRFGEAVLLEKAASDGQPQDHFLVYDEAGGGYISWVRGEAGDLRRITMKLEAAVDRTASESRLQLSAPRATVSELALRVPLAKAAFRVTGEAVADEPRPEADGSTTLTVRRLDGPLELSWRDAARPVDEESPDLEAVALVSARVDGRTIRTTAMLTLRSFAGEFDRFLVRLPPGANPTPVTALGFQIVEPPVQPTDPGRRMVEVRLDEKTSGPAEVRLETERPFNFDDPEPLELGGFEVDGAVRQSGYLAVRVLGDWRVDFDPLEGPVRRVEEALPESLRRDDLAAGFEFLRQPFSLRAHVAPRESRLHVDPEYVYLVGAAEVRLDARIRFTVRGAKAFEVRIDLPGWEVEEIGPGSLLKADEIERERVTPLVLPLAKATTGQFELTLRARRALAAGEGDLTIGLPSPRADTASPAAVVVLPDDNVELRPKADGMLGLNRQRVAPALNLPVRQQEPLFYRADGPAASFAAEWLVHEQAIGVDVAGEATWDERQSGVEQRFSYRVEHEPVETLLLDLPASIVDAPGLEVLLDGAALPLRESAGEAFADNRVLRRVELPAPRIGTFDLMVRYPLASLPLPGEGATPWTVPLVMPAEGTLGTNELRVRTTGGTSVAVRSDDWKSAAENGGAPGGSELRLTAATALPQADLALAAGEPRVEGDAVVVDRAWIQSWLTEDARLDRAAFRFSTDRPKIAVTLPRGVVAAGLMVQLDGRAVPLEGTPRRTLEIAIPVGRRARVHTLELQYRFAAREAANGVLAIAAPQLPDDAWVQRLYWQVALPPDEHVLQAPADLAGELRWAFHGLGWQREPLRDQRQLEEWVGVESRAGLPSGANVYLYSALSARPALELRVASRSMLVFAASLAALSAGLIVMYAPPRGRRLAAFVAVGAAVALAAMYPEASVLLLQAAGLGLVLAALAMLLERLLSRRQRRPLVRRAPSSIVERRSTEVVARPQLVAAPASTMTAAVEGPPPAADDSP